MPCPMINPTAPPTRQGFKIAIICAVQVEAESVRAVFDRCWDDEGKNYGKVAGDKNTYTTGIIGRYNVVMVLLPGMGGVPAAQAAASLSSSYPKIELVLVVGVCGVVPVNPETGEEIVLGDVIISTAVTQYDFGRTYPGGFLRKTSIEDSLRKAPKEIQGFMNKLAIRQTRRKLRADLIQLIGSPQFQEDEPTAIYPGAAHDHLYEASYLHQHRPPLKCDACHDGLDAICSMPCKALGCETERLVVRQRLHHPPTSGQLSSPDDRGPLIHLGRIGSANSVMKSGVDRDMLATKLKFIGFEMEGAGVWDEHPTIMIKGACDYADSHKDKRWQAYAAMMAAGCLKVVLDHWVVADELADHDTPRSLGLCLTAAPLIQEEEFVGRAVEIDAMHDILHPHEAGPEMRRVVLGGIGGIGKTQLALAYARKYQRLYNSVLWLNATSESTLYASLRSVAQVLRVAGQPELLDNEQVLAHVRDWLTHADNTRWLLIFDNYDDPKQYDLNSFLPNVGHGSTVITTRLPDQVTGQQVRVRPLTAVDDSLDILQIRSGREDVKKDLGARRLAERMAGLPLALVTAGAFLRKNTLSFQKYLEVYEERWQVDRRRPLHLQDYQDRTLYTTWNLTYARIEADDTEAAQMLKLLAYFDHQAIWYELFQAGWSDQVPAWLPASLTDHADFESVMSTLVEYCLVEVQHVSQSHGTYSMHSCVHDWTLGELNAEVDPQLYWYAFDCVAASIDRGGWHALGQTRYGRVGRHAVRLAHHRFEQCDQFGSRLSARPEQAAWIAQILLEQVQLSAAEHMVQRTLAGFVEVLGLDHTWTLHTLDNLGTLYSKQGKLAEAEQMYDRALAGIEKALGPEHTSTLDTVSNLGIVYWQQGKLAKAEQMHQRALAGMEKALGPEHTSTLKTISNLGSLYWEQGRLVEAEHNLQRAFDGWQSVLGPDHYKTKSALNNLDQVRRQASVYVSELLEKRSVEEPVNT